MRNRNYGDRGQSRSEKHRINDQIDAPEVRVIGSEGQQLGILKLEEALNIAAEESVDLVEVAPTEDPPVCRILDYGKLKYREQKKATEAKKHSASQTTKELRVRYNTDSHDLETKVRKAVGFLEAGDRVKFQMRFRGREVRNKVLGDDMFARIAEMLEEAGSVEQQTPLIGRIMTITFVPKH